MNQKKKHTHTHTPVQYVPNSLRKKKSNLSQKTKQKSNLSQKTNHTFLADAVRLTSNLHWNQESESFYPPVPCPRTENTHRLIVHFSQKIRSVNFTDRWKIENSLGKLFRSVKKSVKKWLTYVILIRFQIIFDLVHLKRRRFFYIYQNGHKFANESRWSQIRFTIKAVAYPNHMSLCEIGVVWG